MTAIDDATGRTEVQASKAPGQSHSSWRRALGLQEMGVFYALALLITVLSIITAANGQANYLSIQNMSNVVYQTSLIGMMAIAMTVVLISGNFDLSVASVAAFSAVIYVDMANKVGFWPAVAIAMGAAFGIGVLNGVIVQFVGINAFIVTLGTMTAARGLILLYTDGRSLAADEKVADVMQSFEGGEHNLAWLFLGVGLALLALGGARLAASRRSHRPIGTSAPGMVVGGAAMAALAVGSGNDLSVRNPVIFMMIFGLIVWFTLRFTTIGRRLYAVGGNPEAARLSGINVTKYRLMSFVFCSATAGFAGILFASRLRSINPAGLQGAELTVVAAAILGGTALTGGSGSVVKSFAGALLLYSLSNGFNILNLGANWQGLIEGVVVVVAAAIYTIGQKNESRTRTRG